MLDQPIGDDVPAGWSSAIRWRIGRNPTQWTVEHLRLALPGLARPALYPHLRLDKTASAVYTSRHDGPEPDFADPSGTGVASPPCRDCGTGAEPRGGGAAGVCGVRFCRCPRVDPTRGLPQSAQQTGGVGADCAAGLPAPGVRSRATVSRRAGGGSRGGARYGGSGRGVVAGAGRGGSAAPGVEYLAALRASARDGDVCRLPDALSGCFGARGARRGRVFGVGAALAGARGVDGVEHCAAPSPSAPGAVPEPVADPPRRTMPQLGQPGAGLGAAASAGGFRGPLPVPPVAGGDLCRPCARRSQLQGGQFRVGGRHHRSRASGPGPPAGQHGQVGLHV